MSVLPPSVSPEKAGAGGQANCHSTAQKLNYFQSKNPQPSVFSLAFQTFISYKIGSTEPSIHAGMTDQYHIQRVVSPEDEGK